MASLARPLRTLAARRVVAPTILRTAAKRTYGSTPPPPKKSGGNGAILALLALGGAGAGYYAYSQDLLKEYGFPAPKQGPFVPTYEDYQKVYEAIAEVLEEEDYDDGSYGPVRSRPIFARPIPATWLR